MIEEGFIASAAGKRYSTKPVNRRNQTNKFSHPSQMTMNYTSDVGKSSFTNAASGRPLYVGGAVSQPHGINEY